MAASKNPPPEAFEPTPPSEAELIMVGKPDAGLRASMTGVASATGADVSVLSKVLEKTGANAVPLFGDSEDRIRDEQASLPAASEPEGDLPDLSVYYRIAAPAGSDLEALCGQLTGCKEVAAAYVKPPTYPAHEAAELGAGEQAAADTMPPLMDAFDINEMMPDVNEAPPQTRDFTTRQAYLNASPVGVDALYAWRLSGGRGRNVRICDVEGGWNFGHEDLRVNQSGVIGQNSSNSGWLNHGTAVVGEIGGDRNAYGITGICPDANVRGVSIFGGVGTSGALRRAASVLRAGDIILIELHRPGPNATGNGQQGFIPIEWWPDDYAAIRYAVNKGIVVVEAAGNGGEDLDAAVYNQRPAGFPADWRNPFNRRQRDSGAILVGAGAPPPGTNGRNHGPDRSRLGFSNYGAMVDAQGWGREVVTTGYGDLQGGRNRDLHYTAQFSGTSSASPIVVGALGCVQGVLRARGRIPLSPARARSLLRGSGAPQTDGAGRPRTQRIGNRPNLRQLIPLALRSREWVGVQFHGSVPANASRRWFTHSWPAHWHVSWSVVPVSPRRGGPQISYDIQVERASDAHITYWITVRNHTSETANIEARYAVHGW